MRSTPGGLIACCLTAVLIAACHAAPASTPHASEPSAPPTGVPATTAPPGVASTQPPLALEGRLVYARFDLELADMTVWVANGDGSDAHPLVGGAHYLVCVTDAEQVVMAGPSAGGLLVLSTVGLDGAGYRELPSPDGALSFGVGTCTPDGRVAVEGWDDTDAHRAGIYLVDLGGKADPVRLTEAPAGHHDIPGCVTADGRVAFLRAGVPNDMGTLQVIALDGRDAQQIGDRRWKTGPACSPDGTSLLVEADGDLFLVNLEDGVATEVTSGAPDFAAHKYLPAFGPGGIIGFSLKSPGPFHDLYAMRLDGRNLTRLTYSRVDNESPYWVVDP
jgi:hypothetical protein